MDSEQIQTSAPGTAAAVPDNEIKHAGWWDAMAFDGKEFTDLQPDGTLLLKATPFAPERSLQVINADTASAIIRALREKFNDVEGRVHEVAAEWAATEDKSKLSSKVARAKEYLLHAVAIGDFTPLYQQVALWDNILQEGMDKAYTARLALVEKAESITAAEPTKEATQELREIGEQWKSIGHVDKERADALWNRLEAARNSFFDRKRERHDAEQAELSSNLDLKTEIVDKAEKLAASDGWKEATEGFKTLMDSWKATGRTFNDKNEALWQRFITAKNVFYDRKKQHFETIQTEQEGNYSAKQALVEEAERLAVSTDWGKTSNAYNALMDKWKSIGRVPVEKADELWNRLSKAKDTFFNAKRQHFATVRVGLDDNYAQKAALVKQAESLQYSTDWRAATDEFAELMEEWKKIGPVAREHSEVLWESFIKARRAFFNRKDEDRDRRRGQIERAHAGRISQTREFLARLRDELKDDEENLADFHASLGNLSGGKKDDQIRANLEKLIGQAGPKMQKKREKIAEVEAQLATITKPAAKKPRDERGGKEHDEAAHDEHHETVQEEHDEAAHEEHAQPADETDASTAFEDTSSPTELPPADDAGPDPEG